MRIPLSEFDRRRLLSVVVAAVAVCVQTAQARVWTDTAGRTLEAELLRVENGNAVLAKPDGGELIVSVASLGPQDRAFVEQKAQQGGGAAAGVPKGGASTLPGGVALVPGEPVEFVLGANAEDRKIAEVDDLDTIQVSITVPEKFDPNGRNRFLIASDTAPGKNAETANRFGKFAASHGYVVLGAQSGDPKRDKHGHHEARDACLHRAMQELFALWPKAKAWPHYHAGFSGGSKNCFYLAAYALKKMNVEPSGFFMGGSNSLELGNACKFRKAPKSKFKDAAYFVSNGTADKIAPPKGGEEIAKELRAAGARNVRFESYEGGHQLNRPHFAEALEWFIGLEPKPQ